jgi:hypothetical protein
MTCRHCALVFSNLAMDESSSPRSSEEAGTPATAVARRQGRPSAPSQAGDASSGSYGGDLMRRSALASAPATWPSLHNSESSGSEATKRPRAYTNARARTATRELQTRMPQGTRNTVTPDCALTATAIPQRHTARLHARVSEAVPHSCRRTRGVSACEPRRYLTTAQMPWTNGCSRKARSKAQRWH